MKVRAKFYCQYIKDDVESEHKYVDFSAVTGDSEENLSFSKYTPSGNLNMSISYETPAANAFKLGKEYYIDIIPVE